VSNLEDRPVPRSSPRFWFAPNGFENSPHPCICVDDPMGGDPKVLGIFAAVHRPADIAALCEMANHWLESTDRD
jgi:hypothetical protein